MNYRPSPSSATSEFVLFEPSDILHPMSNIPLLRLNEISKRYGSVLALSEVSFQVEQGEILAVVGNDSAGKSSLMKVVCGVHPPDTGEILFEGLPVRFASAQDARRRGIEMVFQDYALYGDLDVAHNLFLGRWPRRWGLFIDRKRMYSDARTILDGLGLQDIATDQTIASLSGGVRQAVAIARATSFDPKLVVFDEPMAHLSVHAIDRLYETMRQLKARHVAQIFVTRHVADAFKIADRILVLRYGCCVGERRTKETTETEILDMTIG